MRKLIAVDGSSHAQTALIETLERAQKTNDDLAVAVFDSGRTDASLDEIEQTVRSLLGDSDLAAPVHRLEDHPGSELVELADGTDFDRLLIGVQTQTPLGKVQLGPVAQFVVMNAATTVTLVRADNQHVVASEQSVAH